jgi:hypothetical protein
MPHDGHSETSEEKKKAKNRRGYDIRFRMASHRPSKPSQEKPKQPSFSRRKSHGKGQNQKQNIIYVSLREIRLCPLFFLLFFFFLLCSPGYWGSCYCSFFFFSFFFVSFGGMSDSDSFYGNKNQSKNRLYCDLQKISSLESSAPVS